MARIEDRAEADYVNKMVEIERIRSECGLSRRAVSRTIPEATTKMKRGKFVGRRQKVKSHTVKGIVPK